MTYVCNEDHSVSVTETDLTGRTISYRIAAEDVHDWATSEDLHDWAVANGAVCDCPALTPLRIDVAELKRLKAEVIENVLLDADTRTEAYVRFRDWTICALIASESGLE